jgi:hypothetical protein
MDQLLTGWLIALGLFVLFFVVALIFQIFELGNDNLISVVIGILIILAGFGGGWKFLSIFAVYWQPDSIVGGCIIFYLASGMVLGLLLAASKLAGLIFNFYEAKRQDSHNDPRREI